MFASFQSTTLSVPKALVRILAVSKKDVSLFDFNAHKKPEVRFDRLAER